jgi:two-component system sensor histidine kinase KdpD
VVALLDFARSHRVSDVLVGRTHEGWWRRLTGRSVMQRMVDEASDLDVHVVAFSEEEAP